MSDEEVKVIISKDKYDELIKSEKFLSKLLKNHLVDLSGFNELCEKERLEDEESWI